MSFRNIYFDTKKSKIYLWQTINEKRLEYDEIDWSPYLYVKDDDSVIETIDGNKVKRKTFNTYFEYYNYSKNNLDIFENNVRPEIQYLTERYYRIPDEDIEIPKLRIYSIDIEINETDPDSKNLGFPHAHLAEQPIVLISIYDNLENKTHTFGLKEYNGKYKGQEFLHYVHCKDERALLLSCLHFMNKYSPDIITGWNNYQFDLQYIVNRVKVLFGETTDLYKKLSPINIVRTWFSKDNTEFNIDIAGVTILDYMDLVKWYLPNKLEKYSLDFVCKTILEKGKVDYSEYKNLRQLYFENWDLYVEYNIIDAYRVYQLEEQLGYIKLVQSLSLLCKAPMKYYNVMTQLIEGLLLTYFRRNNMCAPYFYGGTQETFEAAYVKEPQVGKHEWLIDCDITSSYPTAIITLNISNETFYGRIQGFTEDEVMYHTRYNNYTEFDMIKDNGLVHFDGKRLETFNKAIEKKLLCVAPCGSVFSTKDKGKIAEVTENVFNKRIEVKDKMNRLKRTLSDLRDDNLVKTKEKIAKYHSLQNSLKIIINAIYGITSVPYSRYFNIHMAEAIVSCGRQTIKAGERFTNKLLNDPTDELNVILEKMRVEISKL